MENQKSETKLLKRESMLGKEVGVFKCPLLFLVFFDLEKRGTRSIMWKNQFWDNEGAGYHSKRNNVSFSEEESWNINKIAKLT